MCGVIFITALFSDMYHIVEPLEIFAVPIMAYDYAEHIGMVEYEFVYQIDVFGIKSRRGLIEYHYTGMTTHSACDVYSLAFAA